MHNEIINTRIEDNDEYFFVDYEVVRQCGNIDIIRRRDWLGICIHNDIKNILLDTIADDIVASGLLAAIKIGGQWALFDLSRCSFLFPPEYDALQLNGNERTVTLLLNGKQGLYSLQEKRVVIPTLFDDCTNNDHSDYLWVRSGSVYQYVRKSDGSVIDLGDADMAYDTDDAMLVKHGDRVICLNAEGYEDELSLRSLVMRGNGRLKIVNSKLHFYNIIDIYGYILE